MNTRLFFTVFLVLPYMVQAQEHQDAIQGLWLNHDGSSIIEIYQENDKFFGKIHEILKLPEDKVRDLTEAQRKMGKEKMKGRLLFADLIYEKGQWIDGKLMNPKDNSIKAKCSLSLGNQKGELRVKIKKGIFSATKTWTRYENSNGTNEG